MKKVLVSILIASLILIMSACGSSAPSTSSTTASGTTAKQGQSNGEIVLLVSAAGTLDDRSFNQACYQGIKKFAADNNMTYTYYQPTEDTVDAQMIVADTAVKAGAKFIVINSDQFKVAASQMITKYPDVTFIIYDTVPVTADGKETLTKNVLAIHFAEQQAAFLAGYAAVKDGNTNLGFMGGQAVPAVVRFGYGFIQGADKAAQDLGLTNVTIKYHYTGNFQATPENQAATASWYQSGTSVIFACGGPMGASVFAAAEQNKGLVIGVDSDQSAESPTIITSATKDLATVTYNALADWKAGKFVGGKVVTYTAKENGVGLPMQSSKFKNFTQKDYDDLYKRLANDTDGMSSALATDTTTDDPTKVPVKAVKVEFVQ